MSHTTAALTPPPASPRALCGKWKLDRGHSDHISAVLKILGAGWLMCTVADRMGEVMTIAMEGDTGGDVCSRGGGTADGHRMSDVDASVTAQPGHKSSSDSNSSSSSSGGGGGGGGEGGGESDCSEAHAGTVAMNVEASTGGAGADAGGDADALQAKATSAAAAARNSPATAAVPAPPAGCSSVTVATKKKFINSSEESETFVVGQPKNIRDDDNPKYFFTTVATYEGTTADTACLVLTTKLSMNRGIMTTTFQCPAGPRRPDELTSTIYIRHRNSKSATVVRRYKRAA